MPYVDNGGIKIYFEVVGDGLPLVLHTGGGGDGRMWDQAGYLRDLQSFRCVLIDHRGHGRSDKPLGRENHGVERYVDDVIAVLDELAIERAAFWGYSSGATVGYGLAAAQPDRLVGLIATGAIGARDYDHPAERRAAERRAALARKHGLGHLISELEEAEHMAFPVWFWQQMTDTQGEMFALEVLGEADWHGPWALLAQIATPVLMLVGELEDPDGDNAHAAAILPNARSVTFPGLGHVGAYLRSDLALAEAMPFLEMTTKSQIALA